MKKYLPTPEQYDVLNTAAWKATQATRAYGAVDVAKSCVADGYMTEPSPGYFKLTAYGWEARDAYAARYSGWTYPEDRRHPEFKKRRAASALPKLRVWHDAGRQSYVITSPAGYCFSPDTHEYVYAYEPDFPGDRAAARDSAQRDLAELRETLRRCTDKTCEWCYGQ